MLDTALIIQGNLFTRDFLIDGISATPEWLAIDDAGIDQLHADLSAIYAKLPLTKTTSESQTEDDLIWPILGRIGWVDLLRQQNLAVKGRDDVPDGLLFADADAKTLANKSGESWKRYAHGLALVESKRWARPLDRRTGGKRGLEEAIAPSTQMLRYLRRAEDLTEGKLRWGILTNGGRWRLYFQGARSISEEFFEIDLASVLQIEGHEGGLFALTEEEQRHWLRVFVVVFSRASFIAPPGLGTTFHLRALALARFYEEHVAASLSKLVFDHVFPRLARAVAAAAPTADLNEVRDATLVLLYRLLFILYAEDRDLLPVRDPRYDNYSLRDKVRLDVGKRKDAGDTFSETQSRYWNVIDELCRAIDKGDASIGLPPYNGGLFDETRTPLLKTVRIGDTVIADVIDALSFDQSSGKRKYINYRDLSVRQLGSIYERLLEHEMRRVDGVIEIRPNVFARKGSGSYYTPDDLVSLIIRETLEPLIAEKMTAFRAKMEELAKSALPEEGRRAVLTGADPATQILSLRICDPAMGSGHFLVALVDYLTDQVIAAVAEAEKLVEWGDYVSPLGNRIEEIRQTIFKNATDNKWTVKLEQLDDRHVIRRMVLKRCVFGVDKNPMAVELSKVSLWLHTFTVGAPLSFLDHHLRCGDSLFGSWVRGGIDRASKFGAPLLLHGPMTRATTAAVSMQIIEGLTDVEIAEAHRSKTIFDDVYEMTAPLNAFLSLIHAFDWLDIKGSENRAALTAFFDGQFGDPVQIALGKAIIENGRPEASRFKEIFAQAQDLVREERFLNWQIAFPGVWSHWESAKLTGGFDAVIGNPPWDRMKLQEVEWFATRRPAIAMATRASDRTRMVKAMRDGGDPLVKDYDKAANSALMATRVARDNGDYPLLSGGDLNIYSLFVERAMTLVKPQGIIGLLTPSGIASDKTASKFFSSVATGGRLAGLYDFENRRTRYNEQPFFPDVDSRFKFNAFIASPARKFDAARCAFFLQGISELSDPDRCFPLSAKDFARVNPNTGTAPIFRTRRDAQLTAAIYKRLPVLVDRSGGGEVKAWPVRYLRMFDMTNDSRLFRTGTELEEKEAAWRLDGNHWRSGPGDWLPLYEGKMVQAYDHRAASIVLHEMNLNRPAQPLPTTQEQHRDEIWTPSPLYWVAEENISLPSDAWFLGFKDVTAPTNARSMIAAAIPRSGFGNTLPIILSEIDGGKWPRHLLLANLNCIVFDFVARQKIQGQHLNWFIVEQLPVVLNASYDEVSFGAKSAADIIHEAVLELTYTSNDMAPFARDMGYVHADGTVKPPFIWDERRRLTLRAKLDAIYFHLYGITERDDVRYIYSTFPIVEREETGDYGHYASRDLCLAWMNALKAGKPDELIELPA